MKNIELILLIFLFSRSITAFLIDRYRPSYSSIYDAPTFEKCRAPPSIPIDIRRQPVDPYFLKPFPCQKGCLLPKYDNRGCFRRIPTPNSRTYLPTAESFPYPQKYFPNPPNLYNRPNDGCGFWARWYD